MSGGYNNILVIVDKLTKYGIFIPCSTNISEEETAALFFKYVVAHYGLPRQVITDRDSRWRNEFWGEICRLMGIKRALTTSYHPQADGQTEVLNQMLEIALRAYVDNSKDWYVHVDGIMLAYNSTPHSATTFAPAYLLRGYHPLTRAMLMNPGTKIDRNIQSGIDANNNDSIITQGTVDIIEATNSTDQRATDILDQFIADRQRAMDALKLGQAYQKANYDKGRRDIEFAEEDLVLINPHSLELLKKEKGKGIKLLTRYDGPFEIIRKISPTTYQLKLPTSYGIHPIINIAHLVKYTSSPPEFGERQKKEMIRESFRELPEVEVEKIVDERIHKASGKKRRQKEYKVRFVGFDESHDEWLTKKKLRNAPAILKAWNEREEVTSDLNASFPEKRGKVQKSREIIIDSNIRRGSRIRKPSAKHRD